MHSAPTNLARGPGDLLLFVSRGRPWAFDTRAKRAYPLDVGKVGVDSNPTSFGTTGVPQTTVFAGQNGAGRGVYTSGAARSSRTASSRSSSRASGNRTSGSAVSSATC